ncbi:nucleolar protein 12 [Zygosaccharomyces mellis]|uniref:Nucleolar protein 12 n=1 Tax=Zygosaccharomyces mellis TaxID=42258 RepID=A0A4C2E0D1_9SACH|nr:nucleolar protein 12 [Zygosaccharomyces mellis]
MSSSVENLFGNVNETKIESNVGKLFSTSSGPIDKSVINAKKRVVLPGLSAKDDNDEFGQKTGQNSGKTSEEEPEQEPKEIEEDFEEQPEGESEEESEEEQMLEPVPKSKLKSQAKKRHADEDDGLEERYFAKLMDEDSTQDVRHADRQAEKPQQIELRSQEGAKKIDLKEDELEKAERTVFVGNVPADVITDKSLYRQFRKLFQDEMSLESIRFRSISFEVPLPRKVAFVQQKLHKSRGSINAYVVYKDRNSVSSVCSRLNGQVFVDRHLRVDSVTHPAKHDNKRSVFVGNLDFEEDEESLWKHFGSCGEIEYVRIIRDPKTNVGKGFAYVQFRDFPNVNKALLLNDKPLESNGRSRNLRVTRCKNLKKSSNNSGIQSLKNGGIFDKLSESHKTKLGRAKKVLNKADSAQLGKEITVEGLRASKANSQPSAILKRRKKRSQSGRVTKRSQAHKKKNK